MSLGFQVSDVRRCGGSRKKRIWCSSAEDNFIHQAQDPYAYVIEADFVAEEPGFCPAGGDDDVKSEVEVVAVRRAEDESEDEEGGRGRCVGPVLSGSARRRRTGI